MMKFLLLTALLFLASATHAQDKYQDLWKQYNQGEFSKVIEQALPLVKQVPDELTLKLLVGRAYTDNQQYKEAVPFLEEVKNGDMTNGWIKAWSLAYLGICHYRLSDYDKSKECLKQCIELNATNNVSTFASKRLSVYGFDEIFKDFRVIEKEHIIFHFQPKSIDRINDIESYMKVREQAFDSISRYFGSKIPKKIDFFVWGSKEDAMKTLHAQIGFANPEMCIIHTYFNQTVGHELTHVVSNYLKNTQTKTRLINEGTAVYFDMTARNRMKEAESALQNGDPVNIKMMWSNPAMPESFFYPVAGAFVEYLIQSGGKDKFLRLFTNQTLENAYQVYGNTLDSMINHFERKFGDTLSLTERDSIRAKNIRIIDSSLKKVVLTESDKRVLIVINTEEYPFDEYQAQKQNLKVLTTAVVNQISLIQGQAAETLSKAFKHDTKNGILLITLGNVKVENPLKKAEN